MSKNVFIVLAVTIILAVVVIFRILIREKVPASNADLLKNRVIYLTGEIDDEKARTIVEQLLRFEKEYPNKEIRMYIDSTGGSVTSGFAIYDTIKYIKCDVSTIVTDKAYGMAVLLLSSGIKGRRFANKDCQIAITGLSTQKRVDGDTQKHIESIQSKVNTIWIKNTGQNMNNIIRDSAKKRMFNATEAKDYGLIDGVLD